MGTMSDERVTLRNTTGQAVELGPSARPVPAIVPPDGIVEVDQWAVASLKADGWKTATKAQRAAAEDDAAARLAELAVVDVPPAADDTTDDDAAGDDATHEES